MPDDIDHYELRINGAFVIEKPVEVDREYTVGLRIGVTSSGEKISLQNGKFVLKSKAQVIGYGKIVDDQGTIIRVKKKGSMSQKARFIIHDLWYEAGCPGGDEGKEIFYIKEMSNFIESLKRRLKT